VTLARPSSPSAAADPGRGPAVRTGPPSARVSVVIPTRNRAQLLRSALKSALAQDVDGLEVVVSDNGTDEAAREVVEAAPDPRVRYVRTGASLPMPESWEFAFGQARGEYVTYLTDDSWLLPMAARRGLEAIEAAGVGFAVWNFAVYHAADWLEPERRNVLTMPRSAGRELRIRSHDALERMYALAAAAETPKFLNTLVRRALAEQVQGRQGRLFLPPAPDYSGGVGLLQAAEEYVYLETPLYLDGKYPQSIGAVQMFNWGDAAREFAEEIGSEGPSEVTLNLRTVSIVIARSLAEMRRIYPRLPFAVAPEALVRACVHDLVVHEDNGVDTREAWAVLEEHLRTLPPEARKAADAQRRRSRRVVWLKRLRRLPFSTWLERLRGYDVRRGSRNGFHDLEGAAAFASARLARDGALRGEGVR
jgi:glycosyltransferase involved in cell wall biosynthesis